MMSRSNSASAPKNVKINFPPDVVVSICLKALKADLAVIQLYDAGDEVFEGAAQPVKLPDNKGIPCTDVRKRVCQAVSMKRLLSRGRIELVGPGVDDGFAVNVVDVGEDPRLEFFLGSDADVAEHRACHLEEESFDQV
jgi:hypothetical protein